MTKHELNLERLLKDFQPDIKVPEGLAMRISKKVSRRALVWDRWQIIQSGLVSFVALAIAFYGLTGFILSAIESELIFYISSYLSEPSLIFTSIGFRAFVERLPLVSMILFTGSSIFTIYYFARLVRINSHYSYEKAA